MSTRTFDHTRRLAKHLGEKVKIIDESKMPWSNRLHGKSKQLLGIYDAMTVIAETPNASINDTALQAFNKHVDDAIVHIKAWATLLFAPEEENTGLLDDDEIAF